MNRPPRLLAGEEPRPKRTGRILFQPGVFHPFKNPRKSAVSAFSAFSFPFGAAMIDLTSLIESIEKLAYNILIWVLLVPRTLVKIVFNPGWVPDYVSAQLKDGDVEDRFGDYISPVILILLATLLPFAYAYITPLPAVTLHGPGQANVNTDVSLDAGANFISNTGEFTYDWTADGMQDWRDTSEQNKDFVTVNWNTPGWKLVTVTAGNASQESYYDEKYIYISDPQQNGASQTGTQTNSPAPEATRAMDLVGALEGPAGILAALAFLSIPLLFALATDALRGQDVTRTSLMRSFFIQCYYFSPFGLAAWSLVIGVEHLLTPVQFPIMLLSLAVVLFMLVWLVRNETNLIAQERGLGRFPAFVVVLGCLALIVAAALAVVALQGNAELLRLSLGWFYVAAVAAFVLIALAHRIYRNRQKHGKEEMRNYAGNQNTK